MRGTDSFAGAWAELRRQVTTIGRLMWASILSILPTRLRRDEEQAVFFLIFSYFGSASAGIVVAAWGNPTARLFGFIGVAAAVYWGRQVWIKAGR